MECMAKTRNDNEHLGMRVGKGMDMRMDEIMMAGLDWEVCI